MVVHGVTWKEEGVPSSLNGYLACRPWHVLNVTGQIIGENNAWVGMMPFDYYTWMFPIGHLQTIVTLTNLILDAKKIPVTTASEILRFIGVIVRVQLKA